jgi:hypothetical protein
MQAAQGGSIRRRLWLTQENVKPPDEVDVVKSYDDALAFLKAPFA